MGNNKVLCEFKKGFSWQEGFTWQDFHRRFGSEQRCWWALYQLKFPHGISLSVLSKHNLLSYSKAPMFAVHFV